MSHVARAYETWWSLSLAPDDEELVRASEHKEGAEEARLQAIRWYERILRDAPTSVEARHARRVLVQITVGVDRGTLVLRRLRLTSWCGPVHDHRSYPNVLVDGLKDHCRNNVRIVCRNPERQ